MKPSTFFLVVLITALTSAQIMHAKTDPRMPERPQHMTIQIPPVGQIPYQAFVMQPQQKSLCWSAGTYALIDVVADEKIMTCKRKNIRFVIDLLAVIGFGACKGVAIKKLWNANKLTDAICLHLLIQNLDALKAVWAGKKANEALKIAALKTLAPPLILFAHHKRASTIT